MDALKGRDMNDRTISNRTRHPAIPRRATNPRFTPSHPVGVPRAGRHRLPRALPWADECDPFGVEE
jgi:hypothetical protein